MTEPRLKWRLASGLQKAVRRGRVELAGKLAADLASAAGPFYSHHRLTEVFAEDRTASAEAGVEIILRGRDPGLRAELGEVGAVRRMAEQLAALPGCRIGDSLWIASTSDEIRVLADELRTAPAADLIAMAIGGKVNWKVRLGSLKALSGTRGFAEAVSAMCLPPAVTALSLMAKPGSLLELLPLSASIVAASDGELIVDEIEPAPEIAGLPSSSYDAHVGEGKRAIGYWRASVDALRKFFDERPHVRRGEALGWSVFTVEGARMDVTLTSELIREIEQYARATFVGQLGLSMEGFELLEQITRENLPKLHRAREKIVATVDAEAAAKAAAESVERLLPP